MAEAARKRLSYAEYLALERETDVRHEFLDGQVWAMAGGTPQHSAIKTNIATLFRDALRGTSCRPYDSDLKVRVGATGLATYPDLTVICGRLERDTEDTNAAVNPVLIVEVLSKDTERWDRGGKFGHYRKLPSLRHYLLVSQTEVCVEHFERQESGLWLFGEHGLGDMVRLGGLDIELRVDPIYEDLPDE